MVRVQSRWSQGWLAAVLGAWAACGACERTTRDTDIVPIRVAEVRALLDRQRDGQERLIVLIDPRPARDYQRAHIPGARHMELPRVPPTSTPDPDLKRYRHIVVYGDNPASPEARGMTKRLMAVGYRGVRWFVGGLEEWKARGYPVAGDGAAGAP